MIYVAFTVGAFVGAGVVVFAIALLSMGEVGYEEDDDD